MKLLLCLECGDIFNLTDKDRKYCSCKKSWGVYVDNLNAVIAGPSIPLGIANGSFKDAYIRQKVNNSVAKEDTCCEGEEFKAFFIPKWAKSVKRHEEIL